jgi:hypothetical protein
MERRLFFDNDRRFSFRALIGGGWQEIPWGRVCLSLMTSVPPENATFTVTSSDARYL